MENVLEPAAPENISKRHFSPITFLAGFGFGAFVGVALALLAVAMSKNETPQPRPVLAVVETPVPGATPTPTPESRPRTKTALDVHLGPGDAYAIIGTLSRGESLDVVGRDAGSDWLAIRFPPGSAGRGWVPVSQLDGATNVDALAIALPTPLPRNVPVIPFTSSRSDDTAVVAGTPAVPRGTPSGPTPTPTANVGPTDVYVGQVVLLPDGRVSVTIGNRGPGDIVGETVFVTVRDLTGRAEQLVTSTTRMPAGATAVLQTSGFRITQPTEVQAIVDPFASLTDPNRGNNTLQVTLTPAASPTPVPSVLPRPD